MKALGLAVLAVSALCAQNRAGFVFQGITRFPGSVVFPGGTSAIPGVQRTFGNTNFPGGGAAQIGVPGTGLVNPAQVGRYGIINPKFNGGFNGGFRNGGRRDGLNNTTILPYPYPVPVYMGESGYMGGDPAAAPPAEGLQQQPNVTVVYPPAASPVFVMQGAPQQGGAALYQPPMQQQMAAPAEVGPAPQSSADQPHYLIAMKDHTIYSAMAYWVQGDTLHYFTDGNTHNQASVTLVDRELTKKLNLDSGMEVKLPPAK
jgi:hypothetical protein